MRRMQWIGSLMAMFVGAVALVCPAQQPTPAPSWTMNATIIEACSCPMFCQCYFDTKPASHAGHGAADAEHFCRFNNAFRVNSGSYGDTKLDGAKFWVAGDLGGDFSKGQMDWAVLHFDPSVTPAQRQGIQAILAHLYPVKWNSFTIGADAPIDWKADKDRAVARLDDGRIAEVVLKRFPGNTDDPIVIHNLRYWGAPRNDGFVLMPNEVQALREVPAGRKPYEFRGTNGFMITFEIKSEDVQKAQG
ncbi:DUF1326 domain-containing protein [Fontivita pretiosa]|uniref:DUF1326 domain-containing protein n=1 Tax=Fontivita pretiosa TaxID=2989684 RepID=UPI003D16925D